MGVQIALQQGAQLGGASLDRDPAGGLEPAQVDRRLAGQRLVDGAGDDLADPRQVHERAGGGRAGQLVGAQRVEGLGGTAERADAVGGLMSPLEQVGDPAQVLGGLVTHSL